MPNSDPWNIPEHPGLLEIPRKYPDGCCLTQETTSAMPIVSSLCFSYLINQRSLKILQKSHNFILTYLVITKLLLLVRTPQGMSEHPGLLESPRNFPDVCCLTQGMTSAMPFLSSLCFSYLNNQRSLKNSLEKP